MYSFGIHEIDNVLMVLAVSSDMDKNDRAIVTNKMIKGFDGPSWFCLICMCAFRFPELICSFLDACKEAGTLVTGGQTIFNPWPIIGGTAMSFLKMDEMIELVSHVFYSLGFHLFFSFSFFLVDPKAQKLVMCWC
jgi:selenide,water dikinase